MFDTGEADKVHARLKDGLKLLEPHIFDIVGDAALDEIKSIAPRLSARHRRQLLLTVKLIEIEQLIEAYGDFMSAARKRRDYVSTEYGALWSDEAFAGLEPERKAFIEEVAARIEGKSPLEAGMVILNLKNKMPKGRELTKEEQTAMVNAFLGSLKEPDRSRYKTIFSMAGFK